MAVDIGLELTQARQERGLELEQIAHETHIRLHYLKALESGEFDRLPSRVQAKGFLRVYAAYLDIPSAPLLAAFENKPLELTTVESNQPQPPAQSTDAHSDQEKGIFEEIGSQLQHQRELLGLSIEDVSRQTHLRDHYLKALEAGDLNGLPSPVQGRGMLQNYAAFIGLDPERLLLRFAEGLQLRQSLKQATRPKKAVGKRPTAIHYRFLRFLSIDILLGLVLVASLVGFVIWGVIQINTMQAEPEPLPTFPSIADSLLTQPEDIIAPQDEEQTPAETEAVTIDESVLPAENDNGVSDDQEQPGDDDEILTDPDGDVLVHLVVRQRAWLRVTVDGTIEYEGRVSPGSAYTFNGSQLVRVYTGNGAAIEIHYNQRSLGPMGIYGEVVERVFSSEGAWTPTPSITPSPTPTPTETPTPSLEGTMEPPLIP
ncbi:MAG: helix-turn-helix domain-containing protein [Anaerolineales bacterium]